MTRTRSATGRVVEANDLGDAARCCAAPALSMPGRTVAISGCDARRDQRDDAAAEGGLVLQHAALGVDGQIDAFAGEAEPEPRGDARRDVASEHRRRQDHQPGALRAR